MNEAARGRASLTTTAVTTFEGGAATPGTLDDDAWIDPHGLADLIKALPCQALDLVFPPELLPEYELEEMVALRVCALQSFLPEDTQRL